MPPLEAVLIGYRYHDRRRLKLVDEYGVGTIEVRKCAADCGYPVWFSKSQSVLEKLNAGAEVVCEDCAERYRYNIRDDL